MRGLLIKFIVKGGWVPERLGEIKRDFTANQRVLGTFRNGLDIFEMLERPYLICQLPCGITHLSSMA